MSHVLGEVMARVRVWVKAKVKNMEGMRIRMVEGTI